MSALLAYILGGAIDSSDLIWAEPFVGMDLQ